jgi:hypothetical protein
MSIGDGVNPDNSGNNAAVSPSPNPPPKVENASALSGWWGWAAAILGLGMVAGFVVLGGVWTYQRLTSAPFVPDASAQQTEAKFQSFVFGAADPGQSDSLDEWRAVRSDHKIIAYSVARCLGFETTKNMTPEIFSMLMLDLWPNGDHWWGRGSRKNSSNPGASPEPVVAVSAGEQSNEPAASQPAKLTPSQAAILAISDEVARARLSAARGANDFYPMMSQFGWLSVIISAIATALVTLKASMNSEHYPRWSMTIGICAVALSTAATVFAGAKQFFDPTGAYMRNESALVALRQLHAEIALDFVSRSTCGEPNLDPRSFARWRNTLVSLENGTIFAPVIVASPTNPLGQSADNVEPIPVVYKPEHPTTPVTSPPTASPPTEKAAADPK